MSASNTKEAYEECIGLTVKGVIYWTRTEHQARTLIFEDGTGLTCLSNGSYWRERKAVIDGLIRERQRDLEAASHDLRGVLAVAGACPIATSKTRKGAPMSEKTRMIEDVKASELRAGDQIVVRVDQVLGPNEDGRTELVGVEVPSTLPPDQMVARVREADHA